MASSAPPRSICVFCGSSPRAAVDLLAAAAWLGAEIASNGARLVYGGGGIGLMGACATAARAAGGEVLGVIPAFLTHVEAAPRGTQIIVVRSMHERKMMMFKESDAFVVMPGAIGTLEEAIELLSWRRLGLHAKPIVFFSPDGFWDPLFSLFGQFIDTALLPEGFNHCWREVQHVQAIMPALRGMTASGPSIISPDLLI